LDTPLPNIYVTTAAWGLAVAAFASAGAPVYGSESGNLRQKIAASVTITAAVIGSAFLLFVIQFLTWTPVGAARIEGVVGRYLIPLALLAASILPGLPVPSATTRFRRMLLLLIAVFPVASIAVMMRAVVLRYYLM